VGLHGPSCLTCVCVFQGDLSTSIRAPLIMVSDKSYALIDPALIGTCSVMVCTASRVNSGRELDQSDSAGLR